MKRISSRSMSTAIIVFVIAVCHDPVAPVIDRRAN